MIPRGELMLGTTVQTLHVTILGASLVSQRLSIVHHIFSIQNFQIKIRSFLHYLFSNFEYYMGNCVHCFMVCSQIRHVSILDASPGFKKLQICHHIRHIDSEHGNIGHTISLPHRLQPSIQSIKQSLRFPQQHHKQPHHNQPLLQTVLQKL